MSLLATIYEILHSKAGLAVLAIAVIFGMWNMLRQPAGNLSQRLMRWRVGLQLAVICIIVGLVLLRH